MKLNRWYDQHPELSKYLEQFKKMKKSNRDQLTKGIIKIIDNSENPDLINDSALDFSLDICRRRWYDKSPYLWLIFNGLSKADNPLLNEVTNFLKKKLPEKELVA
jgi:hypothetical protein